MQTDLFTGLDVDTESVEYLTFVCEMMYDICGTIWRELDNLRGEEKALKEEVLHHYQKQANQAQEALKRAYCLA